MCFEVCIVIIACLIVSIIVFAICYNANEPYSVKEAKDKVKIMENRKKIGVYGSDDFVMSNEHGYLKQDVRALELQIQQAFERIYILELKNKKK